MKTFPDKLDLKDAVMKRVEEGKKKGVVGRYSASQIYAILEGWTTPKDFLEGEIKEFEEAFNLWNGTEKHKSVEGLMKILGYETELKKEHQCKDFMIVGMADYLTEKEVADLKTSIELIGEAKKWSLFQLKLYCTIFQKERGIIYEPVIKIEQKPNKMGFPKPKVTDFYLRNIGETKRDDKWFETIVKKLNIFHEQLKQSQEK